MMMDDDGMSVAVSGRKKVVCRGNASSMFISCFSLSLLFLFLLLSSAAITCGHPGNPGNGVTQGSQFNLNDIVKFACNPGYVLEGVAQSQCQANGQWNHPLPICRSKYGIQLRFVFHICLALCCFFVIMCCKCI